MTMVRVKGAFLPRLIGIWPCYFPHLIAPLLQAEDVDIVKYDAVANDVPQYFTVQGYPTIYLLTSQHKTSPILFNAPRKHSTLLKFVAEKATNQLKSFNREGFSQVR